MIKVPKEKGNEVLKKFSDMQPCYHDAKFVPKITTIPIGENCFLHKVEVRTLVRFLSENDLYQLVFQTGKNVVNKWKFVVFPRGDQEPKSIDYDLCFGLCLLESDSKNVMCRVSGREKSIERIFSECLFEVGEFYVTDQWKFIRTNGMGIDSRVKIDIDLRIFEFGMDNNSTRNFLNVEEDGFAMKMLFQNDFDVILQSGGKNVKAHREILSKNSPVFASTIKLHENQTEPIEIDMEDADSNTVLAMIQFLYTGKVLVDVKDVLDHLLVLAHKYQVDKLTTFCENQLPRYICSENVLKNLSVAYFYDLDRIKEICADYLKIHHSEVTDTDEWRQMEKDNKPLMSLIKLFLK